VRLVIARAPSTASMRDRLLLRHCEAQPLAARSLRRGGTWQSMPLYNRRWIASCLAMTGRGSRTARPRHCKAVLYGVIARPSSTASLQGHSLRRHCEERSNPSALTQAHGLPRPSASQWRSARHRDPTARHCEAQPLAARSLRRGGTWRDVVIHAFMQPSMDRFVPRDDKPGVKDGSAPSLRGAQRRGNPCLCVTANGSLRASR
jgi:hypothetical protein